MKITLSFLFCVTLISSCQRYEARLQPAVASVERPESPGEEERPGAVTSFARESMIKEEYLEWVRDPENGLYREEEIDGLTFSVFYKPLDYVILQELASSGVAIDSFASYKKQYEGLQYFTLTIKSSQDADLLKHAITSERNYYQRIDYCSFRMQNDLQLVQGSDTLACKLFHYERTYQVAPYTNFILAFEDNSTPNTSLVHDKTLVFHDQAFGRGIVKLKLKANDLNKVPKLVIN